VEATVVDEQGVPVPAATNQIAFSVTGPGVVAAVDNASVLSHEPFGADSRSAYQGRCYVWIKASEAKGQITLTANSEQLESDTLSLTVSQ
jgi:beta-galactosidase